jgi:PBP1b-binding outer membrane lipoprotein LpoB
MKYLSLLLISALILNSCGKDKTASTATVIASNDLELIRQKKSGVRY